ncbi:MAG: spore coat U domain-containing protein [Devosia sp.]|nr:spore coat U domain-containing protein [Devosia sp.]
MRKVTLAAVAAFAGCAALAVPAFAASTSTTSNLTVSLQVLAACTVSTTDLVFPTATANISAGGLASVTPGKITVNCTETAPYEIGLGAGSQPGTAADTTTRRLFNSTTTSSNSHLSYDLYSDAGDTTHWGDTQSTDTVSGTGTGGAVDLSVYGKIVGSQNVALGTYSDTVLATVWYDDGTL